MQCNSQFVMFGEVGGRYYSSTQDSDIAHFVEKCAEAGMQRIVCSYYHCPTPEFPSFLMHWGAHRGALMQVESFAYGERSPLARLVHRAHSSGLQVVAFVNVATGGQWIRADYVASGEVWPYVRLIGAGKEQEKYWTRTRDGKTWLDIGPRHRLGATGYLGLSYPEIRQREQRLLMQFIELGVDGIQVEFMVSGPPAYATAKPIDCCDDDGVWAYGYDEPAIREYKQAHGVDPRQIANSDETWMRFRAAYTTQHLREIRQQVNKVRPGIEVSLLCFSGTFRSPAAGLAVGVDWETWLDERLVDVIYSRIPGDRPPLPWRERFTAARIQGMHDELAAFRATVGTRAVVCPVIEMPIFPLNIAGQVTHEEAVATVESTGKALVAAGAESMGFWWFDTVEALNLWPAIRTIRQSLSPAQ